MGEGRLLGFIIWLVAGLLFVGNGAACFKAEKPSGFWANAKTAPIGDVKSYNRTMGKFWCIYGVVFIVLGLPMLSKSGVWIALSCVGVMAEAITAMVVYTIKIEGKYRKK